MSSRLLHRFGTLALAAALLPAASSTCLAQAQPERREAVSNPTERSPLLWGIIDVDFRGGTAVDFIEALMSKVGGKVNIIAMPHVGEVHVPPMKLRGVSVLAAVNLLDGESLQTANRLVRLAVQPIGPSGGDAASLIKVIAVVKEGAGPSGPERSNIWSVADLIAGDMSPEHITTAVSAALELLGPDSRKAQVRYHKETSLLLARADVEQIQIIESVIDQLRRSSAQRRAQSLEPINAELRTLSQRFAEVQEERQAIEKEADERLRLAESAKARAEAMERRTSETEVMVARLREELMQRESHIRALEEELGKLREQAKRNPGGE